MAFNTAGSVPLTLDTFGSWVTEMDAPDLPPGVSPDNQNCYYYPGSVNSRPGFQKYFNDPTPNSTIVYAKSFVLPNGVIKNLFMNSLGQLFVEDVASGTIANLFLTAPGSWCRSITAFGREYIAISDLLHGSDIPLEWDGTNLDRFTQDGPGAAPTVANLIIPASTLSVSGSNIVLPITSIQTVGQLANQNIWTTLQITLASPFSPTQVVPGLGITISGNTNSNFNTSFTISGTITPNIVLCAIRFTSNQSGTGGNATINAPAQSLTRVGNTVTAVTATPHQLQVGYQAQISGLGTTAIGNGITSIVINNEALPGLATVTTSAPHTLVPNVQVVILAVSAVNIGGGITAAKREGDLSTITTTTAHGLSVGAQVSITGVTDATFNGSWSVSAVVDDFNFSYVDVDVDSTSSGGTVSLEWPIPDTPTPTYFNVETCPTANTFTVQVTYSDGTWTTGSVQFPWDGTFYVTRVVTPTVFQYQEYGPNASITSAGTVTPFGQATPGIKSVRVSFLLRDGTVTRPSPPVQVIANGGQYLSVGNLPIGPAAVVGRIVQFTGSLGSDFYYIPVPGNAAGTIVSTATVVSDNTTTSAVFDFSDNTLFAALGTSIPGNDLNETMVIDGALNFAAYEGRILTWGQRSTVQNLLNMGMDGGYSANSPTQPLGWTTSLAIAGALAPPITNRGSIVQVGWLVTVGTSPGNYGLISQSFYQDGYSDPIGLALTAYSFRAYVQSTARTAQGVVNLVATLSSVTTGFLSTATVSIPLIAIAKFVQADFNLMTPAIIPADMLLTVYVQNVNLTGQTQNVWIRDMDLFYTQNPYNDTLALASYAQNYASIDFVTGQFGSDSDVRKIMAFSTVRDTLYFLTQEPSGKLHEVQGTANGEPSTWVIDEVASNCGLVGPNALAVSQADEESASGGEEWMCWMSNAGARIFGGGMVHKISQEIQDDLVPGTALISQLTTWALNDPVSRIVFFGISRGTSVVASEIIPLSYRELDSAESIAGSPPFHPSLAGRLVSTDNTRKWTRWPITMNGASLMYTSQTSGNTSGNTLVPVFFGGTGNAPSSGSGTGNCYTLNFAKYQDDDYGVIVPYYITYMFPDPDQETQLQLGPGMKTVAYLTSYIEGLGTVTFTLLPQRVDNSWPLTGIRQLSAEPQYDLEWNCGSCVGQRIAVRIDVAPENVNVDKDCWFSLSKLAMYLKVNQRQPIRGGI